jgi:hypothetical protein
MGEREDCDMNDKLDSNHRSPKSQAARRGLSLLSAAAVLIAVGVGISQAAIPGADGTISACYKKAGGALRVIDARAAKCKSTEKALRWSQTGPAGAQGLAGPTGPVGPEGPRGPAGASGGGDAGSTVTFAFTSSPAQLGFNNVLTRVVGKSVPAGSWAIVATANVSPFPLGNLMRTTHCQLRNPAGAFIGGATDRREIPSGQQVQVSLSMNGGAVVQSGTGEISLWCSSEAGARADAQIMITKIGGFA